jgi:hypothetical protein
VQRVVWPLARCQIHSIVQITREVSNGKVYELGRDRKPRWSFEGAVNPVDVRVLPNNRVLLAESGKVTERDLKGNIIWEKQTRGSPYNVQRLSSFPVSSVAIRLRRLTSACGHSKP